MPALQHSTEDQNKIRNASDRVVVVAARYALGDYLKYSAYVGQSRRSFQSCVPMSFYTKDKIDRYVPKIVRQINAVGVDEHRCRTDLTRRERPNRRTVLDEHAAA